MPIEEDGGWMNIFIFGLHVEWGSGTLVVYAKTKEDAERLVREAKTPHIATPVWWEPPDGTEVIDDPGFCVWVMEAEYEALIPELGNEGRVLAAHFHIE